MNSPAIVAVDDDAASLRDLERELRERYERHYRVMPLPSAEKAYQTLEELAISGGELALVLSGQRLESATGIPVLEAARRMHPHAKRGLVIAWGDWGKPAIGEAIFASMARGLIDHYMLKPSAPPDEAFHHEVSSLLLGWAESRRALPYTVYIVSDSWSGRAYELRKALANCALPHSFCLADSDEGRSLLTTHSPVRLPVVIFPNGEVLTNPSDAEVARAAGSAVNPTKADYDLVIVGAGPAGLSAAVYGTSEGFSTLVVDQGGVGGQATSSSMIRNYLGFPRGVSGRRLAQRAYDQAWIFGANFAFMRTATGLRREGERLALTLSGGGTVRARAVLLAMGASYRRVDVPELEELNGSGVFYGGPASEAPAVAGRDVFVLGGANSAGQAALHLAQYAKSVTLVVRAASLAAGMSHYLVREIGQTPNVYVRLRTEIVGGGGEGTLEKLTLRDRTSGTEETVDAGGLFIMIGAHPYTEWLPPEIERDDQGFLMTGQNVSAWPLPRGAMLLETSMPAVFAAGDIRHGSVKRVASAVGEGSVAIQLLHELFAAGRVQPGRPVHSIDG